MLVQRTFFAGTHSWVNNELYSVVPRGIARRTRTEAFLEAGATLSTNTYFGRFEASYWQRWTELTEVHVKAEVESNGDVDVLVRASDIGSHVRTMDAVRHSGDGMVALTVPVQSFTDGGALWLEFVAIDAPAHIGEVTWSVSTTRPLRQTAIAICTFNRADDCANTVAALAEDPVVVDLIDAVYLTDQGTDLVESREVFQDAAAEFGDKLHYIRQPNLGGAGGFSRGLFEATTSEKLAIAPTDVLLMDDDVRVEPETVLRLFAFAQLTRSPMLVGAQMLYLYNPDYLLTSAEATDLTVLAAGLDADRWALRDESVVDNIQERRIDAEYNAWWSCLVPSEVVTEIGLPMPYFFQWDDIEYGLRAREHGFPTATVQGAAVWHADFYWKDADDFGKYFYQRNALITAALRRGITRRQAITQLRRVISHLIVAMQYGLALTHMRAVEAFLAGPTVLGDGGIQALADIRAARDAFSETKRLEVGQLPPNVPVVRRAGTPDTSSEDKVLAKRLFMLLTGRQRRGPVAVPYEDRHWWHVSLFTDVYVTDASQNGVRHRVVNHHLAKEQLQQMVALLRRVYLEFDDAAERWRAAEEQLCSRENWERLYAGDTTTSTTTPRD